MSVENYNSMHFDILREIGNIGAGNAVTSMSQMIGRKVDMAVPVVNLVDFKDISNSIGGAENIIVGILVNISGDISGMMMFIVQRDSARMLLEIVMGQAATENSNDNSNDFTDMEYSALQEIGNILTGSYLNALGMLINKVVVPSVPSLCVDMANAILSVPAIEFGKVSDKVLLIESVFNNEPARVTGYFLLVPELGSFDIILSSLGVE